MSLVVPWRPMPANPPEVLLSIASDMLVKGWQPVWCLARTNGAYTPIPGTTGGTSPFPAVEPQPSGPHRLAFRPPPNVVILDVDHYDAKRGADTMDKAEEWLGDLPPTWKVTSRGDDNPSGRYLYRKPADLDFTDSALSQFADDDGHTSVEVVRTAHRFSWAPGDTNHKNGLLVTCFNPDGDACLLPSVDDLPELPQRWTDYLRNPPIPYAQLAYTRPADGPQWWLGQADCSLGSRAELAQFAFDLLASRLTPDESLVQLKRVARDDDPGRPWKEEHLTGLVDANTERKAAALAERVESSYDSLPATRPELQEIADRTTEEFERNKKLEALRDQRIAETIAQSNLLPALPLEEDTPQAPAQSFQAYLKELTRGFPEFTVEVKRTLIRELAKEDVQMLLAKQFSGFKDISRLDDPPAPTMLTIVGKDSNPQPLIAPGSITVISGHRSAGKTWAAALWARQQVTASAHVVWVDFERQDRGLNAKFRTCGLGAHSIAFHVHYTDELPALADLTAALSDFGPYLLVIDAFRGLQARVAPGTSANDSDAIEQVYETYLDPFARAGGSIALLDHLPKAGTTTFGGERKESAADYVIQVQQVMPFTKTTPGFSMLTLTKDRWGVTEKDTVAGYLWMPGDGSRSGKSIKDYPKVPEFRNWAPEAVPSLEAVAVDSGKTLKEDAVIGIVLENPLRLGSRPLARAAYSAYPDLFATEEAALGVVGRLRRDGKIAKDASGNYSVPRLLTVVQDPGIRPEDLQHPEELREQGTGRLRREHLRSVQQLPGCRVRREESVRPGDGVHDSGHEPAGSDSGRSRR